MIVRPDHRLITKQWLTLFTISVFVMLPLGMVHLILSFIEPQAVQPLMPILYMITAGLLFAMWLISAPLIILWVRNLSFEIKADRVTIHKGILSKVQQNIPYRAVTDFMLYRSPYDRIMGIGSIRIQTAGQSINASGYEGNLSGLDNWGELHQNLKDRLKQIQSGALQTGMTDNTPDSQERLLQDILGELQNIRKSLQK